jgi:hypothetical protein
MVQGPIFKRQCCSKKLSKKGVSTGGLLVAEPIGSVVLLPWWIVAFSMVTFGEYIGFCANYPHETLWLKLTVVFLGVLSNVSTEELEI